MKAKTARELLLSLPNQLTPRPTELHLSTYTAGPSRCDLFRRAVSKPCEPIEKNSYREWTKLLTVNLPSAFQRKHRDRLNHLSPIYDLAYGEVIEELARVAKTGRRKKEFEAKIENAINLLLEGKPKTEPQKIHTTRDFEQDIENLINETRKSRSPEGWPVLLQLRSRCTMENGSRMHIPMLDFRVSVSEANESIICAVLRGLNARPGVLLESGKSYHYCGLFLLPEEAMLDFVLRAVLLIPFVDARYLAHCLFDRECCLRITGRGAHDEGPLIRRVIESRS